jgi:hypothetical protein
LKESVYPLATAWKRGRVIIWEMILREDRPDRLGLKPTGPTICVLVAWQRVSLPISHLRIKATMKQTKPPKAKTRGTPSNRGFFIFMACCALGAIVMVALLVGGEIEGARVGPDIVQKAK